jgi:hypothetical protein
MATGEKKNKKIKTYVKNTFLKRKSFFDVRKIYCIDEENKIRFFTVNIKYLKFFSKKQDLIRIQ